MAQKFANVARGLLASGINAAQTTIEITEGGALFPVADGTDWFKAVLQDADGIEIVEVTGHTPASNTFTVIRGREGTTARTFAIGSVFGQRVTAGDMEAAVKGGLPAYEYENRGDLRALTSEDGDVALVEGLGLFRFYLGSDEPDDDESCFATPAGRWLLEAVHWDVVDAWNLPDDDARDAFDEDESLRFDARFGARVLHGTAVNAITTLASISTASFTGTVTGAAVGDMVLITPRAEIGSTANATARLAFYGTVSAADTVQITLVNPSAAAAAINPAVIGAGNPWSIAVLKNI